MANFLRRLYDFVLRHRMAVCLSLGLLLPLPSLSAGFYFDDVWQQALLDAHARGTDGQSSSSSASTSGPGTRACRIGALRVGAPYLLSFESVSFDMTRLDPSTVRLSSEEGLLSGYFARRTRLTPGVKKLFERWFRVFR